jgi:hypothetical protein
MPGSNRVGVIAASLLGVEVWAELARRRIAILVVVGLTPKLFFQKTARN